MAIHPPQGGGVQVGDANAAVGEVLSPKTFYSVNPPKKTGTMADKSAAGTVIVVGTSDQTLPAAGYYLATAASFKVQGEPNLVAAKVKSGVTIGPVTGTYVSSVAHDTQGSATSALTGDYSIPSVTSWYAKDSGLINDGADYDLVSVTLAYAAGCVAEAMGYCAWSAQDANALKPRLYMNGVMAVEGAFAGTSLSTFDHTLLVGNSASMSGSMVVKLSVHNSLGSQSRAYILSRSKLTGQTVIAGVESGSAKAVV